MPLILVLLVEVAFRLGAWEGVAAPDSHAGQAIAMKRQWLALEEKVDVVTLGSSRAVHGLDPAMLVQAAKDRGQVHASFALAGSHWMTVRAVSRWLEANRPEVKRRIIALSIVDYQWTGNGSYELGLVEPLRRWDDWTWIRDYVPFDSHDVATYGAYSSLLAYRSDMADFLRHPRGRIRDVRAARKEPRVFLFSRPEERRETCAVDTTSLAACVAGPPAAGPVRFVQEQCRSLSGTRPDGRPQALDRVHPHEGLRVARDHIVEELRRPRWRGNTVVVLMPTHSIWLKDLSAEGLHEWVLEVLRPLAEDGSIELLDYTDWLNPGGSSDCHAFFDLYHQNTASAQALTREMLERSGKAIYGPR
jgi:hypothetical protein